MIEVKVQSLGLDRSSNTPVVILQELDGARVLPIWIGPGEASAIAMELAGMKFSRPLTHDLFASVILGMGGSLQRVMITKVVENTYFAELIIQRNAELISVDARPSDSIAIALRMSARSTRRKTCSSTRPSRSRTRRSTTSWPSRGRRSRPAPAAG
jgi:uncharacterized protein